MNLAEFKRRLMTDPGDRSAEMRAARQAGGEFAKAAERSDRFERALGRALHVPVPHGLADRIILEQSLAETPTERSMPWWTAIAAVLVVGLALTTFVMLDRDGLRGAPGGAAPTLAELQQHLAWHWDHDGPQAVAMALDATPDPQALGRLLAEMGLQLEPELLARLRLGKFCPTPNGAGIHLVMLSEAGPITAFYMPRTQLPSSPMQIELPGARPSWAVNLDRGSLALVAEPGADLPAIAHEIIAGFAVAPGVTI